MTVTRPARTVPCPLTAADVAQRRARYGPNRLPQAPPRPLYARVALQLRDPLVLVLVAAMGVTAVLRDIADLIVIAMVIVLNTTVGVAQEVRADRAVAALRRMAAPRARVVRADGESVVPAEELVPGDVIRVEAGDIVPADARLDEAVLLRVDEAALTGESVPVSKRVDGDPAGAGGLFAGTVVATGRATAEVTRTGPDSALGRIAALVAAQPYRPTPLQRRLTGLGRLLAAVAVALSGVVLLAGVLRGLPFADMLLAAVSLTVAAVPESLPAVVTVALALGAHRMARREAIVRRLPAVETLGSVTVVAADKTGTLTEGVMSVQRLVRPDGSHVELAGTGYDPTPAGPAPGEVSELLRAVVLCNDAQLAPPDARDDRWRPVGDPMEAALLTAAARCGLDPERLRSAHPRVTEVPFDSTRLRMTTVHRRPGGGWLVAAKGAPEVVLAAGGPVEAAPDERAALLDAARALAADGYRVLAVAERVAAEQPAEPERGLRPLGLAALVDPVRAEAADTIAAFGRAGIRLVVITGDHPATAASVAGRLGVPTETVVVGDRFDPADAHRAGVFARIRPEQKLSIVAALQSRGDVVAMTGDGVNDAPALRAADIGVAMGRGGTEAARQAAALVLADDNLATVGRAVEEGRRIYANIRRFLVYALAGGLAEVLVMLAGPWFGLTVPLLPAQILWINMLTHGLPGVALGAEPADRNVMTDRPRRPDEAILGGCVARRILGIGALITTVAIGAALVAHAQGRAWQSILFTVLGLAQLGVALALRARGTGRGRNWGLDAAVALSLLLQLAALWLAPLRALLGTVALSQAEVGACAAVAAVPALIVLFTMRRKA